MEEQLKRVSKTDIKLLETASIEAAYLSNAHDLEDAVRFLIERNRFFDVSIAMDKQLLASAIRVLAISKQKPDVVSSLGRARQLLYEEQNSKYGVLPFIHDEDIECVHDFW